MFDRQWGALKNHCRSRHLQIIGDLPVYPTYDSADLWTNPDLFKLDEQKRPAVVGGVPPDAFSATGQLWGNPVYNWEAHQKQGFSWWMSRIDRALALVDRVRLDHFRGFVRYWEVPTGGRPQRTGAGSMPPAGTSLPCLPGAGRVFPSSLRISATSLQTSTR